LRTLDENDEATMKVWWWLRSKIEDGLLLSICHAVLEEDLETLETISKVHFARAYGIGEVCAIGCNQTLHSLDLHGVLMVGFLNLSVGENQRSAMALMCQEQKSRLNLRGKGEGHERTYAVLDRAQMLPDAVLAGIRLALVDAVEAKLSRC
jgi:hypothetical protein